MTVIPELITRVEQRRLWSYFHKDWLVEIRKLLRPQLPRDMAIFVESEPGQSEQYSLLIRRAPENRIVAAAEILSPTNKGVFGALDKEKYLRKRDSYFDAGINLLEIDVLLEGDRLLPPALGQLSTFDRTAWAVCHASGRRHYRSWGWSATEPLPKVEWEVESGLSTLVDLALSSSRACEFNPWETLAK